MKTKLPLLALLLATLTPPLETAHAAPDSALLFNGADNYVSATIPALASNYTVSAWVFLRSGGDLYTTRLGLVTGTNCGSSVEVLIRSATTNAADPQYLELGRCGYFNGQCSTNPVPLNRWVHLAISVATNKAVSFYINGEPSGTVTNGTVDLPLGPAIHLGDNAIRKFNGMLDEVQIWSRVLSLAEVQAGMYQAPDTNDLGLVAWWPFSEGVIGHATTADASGHGHAGTLTGWPQFVTSPVGGHPDLRLNGLNPYTVKWHTAFNDPGVTVSVPAAAVAGGINHSLALRADGSVIRWGSFTAPTPASVTNVVAVSAGFFHNVALKADGTLVVWGSNSSGQTNVPATATNVVTIATGAYHSLALRADGTVIAWGNNDYKQTNVPAALTGVAAVACGGDHSLALKADGTVVAWGSNDSNQTNVPTSATNVVAIAGGSSHSLALKSDGSVIGWGRNTSSQITVPPSATNVVAIAASGSFSLALKADGTVVGWGDNSAGQTSVPASATNVVAIAAGAMHSLAVRADASVLAWGQNSAGQASVPDSVNHPAFPVTVAGTVDTNTQGTYPLTYTITNWDGTAYATNRTVVVASVVLGALSLDGDLDQYVTVPDNAAHTFASAFTWEAWVFLTKTNWPYYEEWATIFAKDQFTGEWWFPLYTDGTFEVRFANQQFVLSRSSATAVQPRTWQHVAVTWDGTNVCCYVNGTLKQTQPYSAPAMTDSATPLLIGRDSQQRYHFTGLLDELRLWNVARSQAEIRADMGKTLAGTEAGLVGYWPLDEGAGNTAANRATSTGTSGDGALENNPAWVSGVDTVLNLSGGSVQTNAFCFEMSALFSQTAVLETCTNLAAPNWVPVQTNALSFTPVTCADTNWSSHAQRFYRLRSP